MGRHKKEHEPIDMVTSQPISTVAIVQVDQRDLDNLARQPLPQDPVAADNRVIFVGGGQHFIAIPGRAKKVEIVFRRENRHRFITDDPEIIKALDARGFRRFVKDEQAK